MSVVSTSTDRPSAGNTNASNISAVEIVADEVYSLLDAQRRDSYQSNRTPQPSIKIGRLWITLNLEESALLI